MPDEKDALPSDAENGALKPRGKTPTEAPPPADDDEAKSPDPSVQPS